MSTRPSRRTFLREVTAASLLLPSTLAAVELPRGATGLRAPGEGRTGADGGRSPGALLSGDGPRDEGYWAQVRDRFDFREERVPMNAANLCPSPRDVADTVTRLTHDIDVDCSFQNRARFGDLLEDARSKIAAQLGVSPDEIALVRNTSEANNIVNSGLPLREGDEVVVWDQNHPTNHVAWEVRAARYGFRVRRVSVPEAPRSAQALVDPFLAAFTDRTRVVAFSHISNVSGIRLPVRQIADAAHARDIHVHVDGAQGLGAVALDLREMRCDTYTSSSHKWFMGPKEAGILYVREALVPEIWASGVAPGWGDDAETDLTGARKFESLGQRDDACLAAMGVAADLHAELGPREIEARVAGLATALKEGMREMGVPLVTPMEPALSGGVVIARVAGDGNAVFQRLYAEHGIAGAPTGGLRLSPHVSNTMDHIERALNGVRALRPEILGAGSNGG
ncbi:MAG: aminotransferase class V-fold PLP-dependent enzyme [Gemmatimonadota bacterium]